MKRCKTIGKMAVVVACFLAMTITANADTLTLGNFAGGTNGWTTIQPASTPDTITFDLLESPMGMIDVTWYPLSETLQYDGSVSIQKSGMQPGRQVTWTHLSSPILSRPTFRTTWCGSRHTLLPLGQRVQFRFFWPAAHQYPSQMTIGAAGFGVSQAAFSTMDSLSFAMTPLSATNGAGGGAVVSPSWTSLLELSNSFPVPSGDTLTVGDFSAGQDGWAVVGQGTDPGAVTTNLEPGNVYYEMNWASASPPTFTGSEVAITKSWNATGQPNYFTECTCTIIMYG